MNHEIDSLCTDYGQAPLIIKNQSELESSDLLKCIDFNARIDFTKHSMVYYYVPMISHKDSVDIRLYKAKYRWDLLIELNTYNREKSLIAISKSILFLIPEIPEDADISFIHKILNLE